MDIQKWIKDKGLVDTLLVGSRTKPIYLEALLKEFEQDLVKLFAIPDVSDTVCQYCGKSVKPVYDNELKTKICPSCDAYWQTGR